MLGILTCAYWPSLVGSLLLSPGSWWAQGFVYTLPESVSPGLCKFWRLYDGLLVTSSKRAYAIPRSAAPRAPAPAAVLRWPYLHRRHPNTVLSQSLWGNLYAGQEATVRTGHGTTDCFHIAKGVSQSYRLWSCLFNLYAEYIMKNAGLDEAQAGIKIAGRWRRKWQPTPVLLPGKFHGWRNLVGYSPWDLKELDMTERLQCHVMSRTLYFPKYWYITPP